MASGPLNKVLMVAVVATAFLVVASAGALALAQGTHRGAVVHTSALAPSHATSASAAPVISVSQAPVATTTTPTTQAPVVAVPVSATPDMVNVPNVLGENVASADATISAAGLAYSNGGAPCTTVALQYPAAGSQMPAGSIVELVARCS
jgi:type V secretory pathway adhesin AidA